MPEFPLADWFDVTQIIRKGQRRWCAARLKCLANGENPTELHQAIKRMHEAAHACDRGALE
jgi:hypothetical protein